MPCLPRILLHVLAAVSLVLFAATCVLWARSYSHTDCLASCGLTTERGVISSVGRLLWYDEAAIGSYRYPPPMGWTVGTLPPRTDVAEFAPLNTTRMVTFAGFGVIAGDTGRYTVVARIIPHWSVALLTALLPLHWARAHRRRHHAVAGLCSTCGYDLRATPTRCPECGARVASCAQE